MRCRISTLTLVLALASSPAMACSYSTDCSPGSKCVKSGGNVLGICSGGLLPGNRNDRQPYKDPFDPNRTVGNTCSFNIDCGSGNHCAMGSGIYGVCVRK
jgi:hypothetical protein